MTPKRRVEVTVVFEDFDLSCGLNIAGLEREVTMRMAMVRNFDVTDVRIPEYEHRPVEIRALGLMGEKPRMKPTKKRKK